MNAKVFLDTNILVYVYSHSEIDKQQIARTLVTNFETFVSTKVLQELCNILTRKFKLDYTDAILAVNESVQNNNLHVNVKETIVQACTLSARYGYSFYDSLIISSALQFDCAILYSEDLHHGQLIDGRLQIVNPFTATQTP